MSEVRTFEDLETWQTCRAFRVFVSQQVLPLLLEKKEFNLCDQLKRSSRSITANIAEGDGRFRFLENRKFCSNARGSLFGSLDHIICAADDNSTPNPLLEDSRALFDHSLKLLNG
jgi:four helix bundle protein